MYLRQGDALELVQPGWHANWNAWEDFPAYVQRSYQAARNHIERFPADPGREAIFVLVTPDHWPVIELAYKLRELSAPGGGGAYLK